MFIVVVVGRRLLFGVAVGLLAVAIEGSPINLDAHEMLAP